MNIDPTTLWAITGLTALLSGIAYTILYRSLDKIKGVGYFALFAFMYAIAVGLSSITGVVERSGWGSLSDVFVISAFTSIYLGVRELNDARNHPWMLIGAIWVSTVCLIYYASIISQDGMFRVALFSIYIALISIMCGYHILKKLSWSSKGQMSLLVLLIYTVIFMISKTVAQYAYDISYGDALYEKWLVATGFIILVNLIWFMFSVILIIAEKLQNEVRECGLRDYLTGLLNQKGIEETAQKVIKRNIRTQTPVSLLIVDIDFFKEMNDVYGYMSANDVLIQVGDLITDTLRYEDYGSRYQGDVFMMLLEGAKDEDILLPAQRILHALDEEDLDLNGTLVPCTVSIGIVTSTSDQEFYDLVQLAYEALQEVKTNGGNGIKVSGSDD